MMKHPKDWDIKDWIACVMLLGALVGGTYSYFHTFMTKAEAGEMKAALEQQQAQTIKALLRESKDREYDRVVLMLADAHFELKLETDPERRSLISARIIELERRKLKLESADKDDSP